MYMSPLQLPNNTDVYVSGDVTIDPSAAIAPGVMLQADPDSRIVIAAGVCIGMGVILHVHQGILEVETGAIIGAGALLVGPGKIGFNACIGAGTTILEPSVEAKQVIASGSVFGDRSRQLDENPPNQSESQKSPEPSDTPAASSEVGASRSPGVQEQTPTPEPAIQAEQAQGSAPTSESTALAERSLSETGESSSSKVPGTVHLNYLLNTLLPHRQAFNKSQQNPPS